LEREKLSRSIQEEGEPETLRRPKRAKVPSWTKHLGSEEEHGFTCGRKPLKRRFKAVRVLEGNARAERWMGNHSSIMGEEESFEGRSPRA